jgi:succinate dehydrogenase / fumarate reductase cytochrome b subunit
MAEATRAEPLFGNLVKFTMGSVGSKVVMAVTGLGLWVFIMGHLAGNLMMYIGRDAFNGYAEALHSKPALVWAVRIALGLGIVSHFAFALRTKMMNDAARPVAYAYANNAPARAAAKSMMLTGGVILAFFCYHLAHFTLHVTGPMPANPDPFAMVVLGFQNPLIAIFYIVAQVLLAAHLSHGIYSLFQHVGIAGNAWTPWLKNAAQVIGYGLCTAFASIPLAVLLGVIHS